MTRRNGVSIETFEVRHHLRYRIESKKVEVKPDGTKLLSPESSMKDMRYFFCQKKCAYRILQGPSRAFWDAGFATFLEGIPGK